VRRAITAAILSAGPLLLVGCGGSTAGAAPDTQLTRLGEVVQITDNTTSVQECEFITDLPFEGRADEDAMRALRNEGGRLGANTVLLVTARGSSTITRAEGYLCAD
jgi:hypothetical protein